ncbi:MAG: hypothetical protein ACI9JM_001033 [Halioglobus sp.]|jgi:hypothetical protein
MGIIKILAMPLLVLGLIGCTISTPVVTNGSYEGLANTDIYRGEIFIYRESSFAGVANQYDVMVNGVLSGSLPNGSFFSVDAEPGENKVEPRTLTSFGLGKGSTITVERGNSSCLKLTLNFCVQCKSADIDIVDNEQCDSEIKSLKKVQLK